ncbi:MAG: hypothetical protein ACYTGL_14730 [Planctomycetota bacterium]|jgi:hypothetical protein
MSIALTTAALLAACQQSKSVGCNAEQLLEYLKTEAKDPPEELIERCETAGKGSVRIPSQDLLPCLPTETEETTETEGATSGKVQRPKRQRVAPRPDDDGS